MNMSQAQTSSNPTISVTGEGVVKITPDQVVVNIRVEHEGKTAKEVKSLVDGSVDRIIKFCRDKMKLSSKDIVTEYINLNKNYDYNRKIYHYNSNQSLSVMLKDLTKYEMLLEGLMDAGVNRIDGVHFKASNMEKYQQEARILAMKDAKNKATELTNAIGQTIGKATKISEYQQNQAPITLMKNMRTEMASYGGDSDKETIAAGEMLVTSKVNVTFELK